MSPASTLFERVGGEAYFEDLTSRFYAGVRADPVLAAVYPDDDAELEAARAHLCWFLVQFFGGPRLFDERRGPPRLRMRHAPFAIGPAERDRWVQVMAEAVAGSPARGLDEAQLLGYFTQAAAQLVNRDGPDPLP